MRAAIASKPARVAIHDDTFVRRPVASNRRSGRSFPPSATGSAWLIYALPGSGRAFMIPRSTSTTGVASERLPPRARLSGRAFMIPRSTSTTAPSDFLASV
jgi:hypothetical protein